MRMKKQEDGEEGGRENRVRGEGKEKGKRGRRKKQRGGKKLFKIQDENINKQKQHGKAFRVIHDMAKHLPQLISRQTPHKVVLLFCTHTPKLFDSLASCLFSARQLPILAFYSSILFRDPYVLRVSLSCLLHEVFPEILHSSSQISEHKTTCSLSLSRLVQQYSSLYLFMQPSLCACKSTNESPSHYLEADPT